MRENVAGAGKSAEATARKAAGATGEAVGAVAKRAKGPALAGGAAALGVAGGLLLSERRRGRRKVLGMPVPRTRGLKVKSAGRNVLHATEQVGTASRQIGELTEEIRRTRQAIDDSKGKSPVEVVLRALTTQRGRS